MRKVIVFLIVFMLFSLPASAKEVRTSINLGAGAFMPSDGDSYPAAVLGWRLEGFDKDDVFGILIEPTGVFRGEHRSGGCVRLGTYFLLSGRYEERFLAFGYGFGGIGFEYKNKPFYFTDTSGVETTRIADWGEVDGISQYFEIRADWDKTFSISAVYFPSWKEISGGKQKVKFLDPYIQSFLGDTDTTTSIETKFEALMLNARYRKYNRKRKTFWEIQAFYITGRWSGGEVELVDVQSSLSSGVPQYVKIRVEPVRIECFGAGVNLGIYF
ncbi:MULTISPECIES: hypothetical protein [unclassified Desulfurobacterium]|uniref:hypothetical protein n=1 Tax=Desulfurobacterium sp. TC5-1 TaxID=1158318 RepID=UPI0003B59E87|nr:hypothetical protein [Desulfurobacterium sp. TC5-1]